MLLPPFNSSLSEKVVQHPFQAGPMGILRIDVTMASQPLGRTSEYLHRMEILSFLSGYHAYMGIWTPEIGQALLVKREPTNSKDKNAVDIMKMTQ